MKILKFFTDTETTGMVPDADQVLSYAVILENKEQVLESYEKTLKLKKNVLPNPKALIVNNINPFSKEWEEKSFLEKDMIEDLKKINTKYKDYRPLVIAYNEKFDRDMFIASFKRLGLDFNKEFPMRWDPLPTARQLVEKGILNTPEIRLSFKTYRSSKLEDVYKALGYSSENLTAHSALDDTKMLQFVAHGVYFLAMGKKLQDIEASPENYKEKDVVHIVMDDEKIGLKSKHYMVIYNDRENEELYLLDEESGMTQGESQSIVKLEYFKILDELKVEEKMERRVSEYFDRHSMAIRNAVEEKKNVIKKPKKEDSFDLVIALAKKLEKDAQSYNSLSDDEKKRLDKAEEYLFSTINKGFKEEVLGKDHLEKRIDYLTLGNIKIVLDPVGFFIVEEEGLEILKTQKKTELQSLLLKKLPEDKITLPNLKDFSINKNVRELKEEFETVKAEVFQGGDKFKKDLMLDLLSYYKEKLSGIFNDVEIPNFKLDLSSFLKKKKDL